MLDYDYDSVMHYGATAFSKNGLTTLTATQALPPGVTIGQRSHVSDGDVRSINVLYPVQRNTSLLFRNTGTQPLMFLEGRRDDIDQRFSWTLGSNTGTAATVDTSTLSEGTFTLNASVSSPLWALSYAYPNSTVTTWPASGVETLAANGTSLVVFNAGLILVLSPTLL